MYIRSDEDGVILGTGQPRRVVVIEALRLPSRRGVELRLPRHNRKLRGAASCLRLRDPFRAVDGRRSTLLSGIFPLHYISVKEEEQSL